MIRILNRHRATRARDQRGLTLVELLITVTLLSMITGALSAGFITATRALDTNSARIRENNDAQIVASFLTRDAQAAGGSDPLTGAVDATVGVSLTNDAGCTSAGNALVVRFKWYERLTSSTRNTRIANYFFNSASNTLSRKTCTTDTAGVTTSSAVTLSTHIATAPAPTATCTATCPGLPTAVQLVAYTTNGSGAVSGGLKMDLRASLRPEGQIIPTGSTATTVPLLLLSSGNTCVGNGAASALAISAGGSANVTIYGTAAVTGANTGSCPDISSSGASSLVASGGFAVLAPPASSCNGVACSSFTTPLPDPYAGLTPPTATCTGGSNPGLQGNGHYGPGTYPQLLSVGNATFDPGTYVFCNGLNTSGTLTATNVLFYFNGGTLNVGNGSNDTITASSTGSYAGLAVWQRSGNTTPMSVGNSNNNQLTINGTLYAPSTALDFSNGTIKVTAIVAASIQWGAGGNGQTIIGTPPANPLTISGPASLPAATINATYPATTMTGSGGGGAYIWTATGLPNGIVLDAVTGVLSGSPTSSGSYSVTVTLNDGVSFQVSRFYTLLINAAPVISGPATLPNWTVSRAYPATPVTANLGTTPYSWSATGLPAGLTINAATGVISGTPTATGSFTATATMTDAHGATASRTFPAFTINALPVINTPTTLPNWTVNQAYPAQTINVSNGTSGYTWTASGLPTGLSINASTGVISGTPNTATAYPAISVTVTDAAGASVSRGYSVTINPLPVVGTTNLPDGELTVTYNVLLAPGSGGTPPYTWSAVGLPAGLSINPATGRITGTPTVSGTFNPTVTIKDATNATSNRSYTFDIKPLPTITGPATLPSWTVTRPYVDTPVVASGGTTPYTWSATGLPSGLTINASTGDITGTPTATGTYTVTVSLVDALGVSATHAPYTVVINAVPVITTATVPNGEQTVAYSSGALSTSQGTAPFAWSASGLPPGVTVNAATGALSGTPTAAGAYSVVVTAVDVAGASASKTFGITIIAPPSITNPATLPSWTIGKVYPSQTITSIGGTAPYAWSATGLPTGLTINASTAVVSGTPTATGLFTPVTVKITDALGAISTQVYTITMNAAPAISAPATLPNGTQGLAYTTTTVTATGGTPSLGWSASGLPAGLTINGSTGAISGTPTVTGSFTATVTATDIAGATASRVFGAFTVNAAPVVATASLPDAEVGSAYTKTLLGSSGTTPYTWTSTALPAGLTLSSAGVLSGTPTAASTSNVTFTLTDSTGATATATLQLRVHAQLVISGPATIPAWTINRAYPSQTITATGGFGAYTWSASGLAAGMSFNTSTHVISGTPTVAGTFTVTVNVTDSATPTFTTSKVYTLTINPALAVTPNNGSVKKNKVLSVAMTTSGTGTGPFTWSMTGAPAWVTLNASTGAMGGTAPSSTGVSTFTVTVADAAGATASITFTLTVN